MAIISYTVIDSPFGHMMLGATQYGLVRISCMESPESMINNFISNYPDADIIQGQQVIDDARRQLAEFFSGRRREFSLQVDLSTHGTAFQRSVWQEIAGIPFAQTVSYSQLAARVSRPRAVRAVAHCCAINPLPLIIPCHRVLAKDGSIGGFAWGARAKKTLLNMENHHADAIV